MPMVRNPKTGLMEYQDPNTQETTPVPDDPFAEPFTTDDLRVTAPNLQEQYQAIQQQRFDQQGQQVQSALDAGPDDRPMFAQSAGQFGKDFANIAANAGVAVITDIGDLVVSAGRLGVTGNPMLRAIQAGGLTDPMAGMRATWDAFGEALDDSQNPWTRWRRDTFRSETQAGQAVSNIVRLFSPGGTAKLLGKLPKVSKLLKAPKAASGLARIRALQRMPGFSKSQPAGRMLGIFGDAPMGRASFKMVTEQAMSGNKGAAQVGAWWQGVETAKAAILGRTVKQPKFINTLGKAVAWDLWIGFNVAGEGDMELDETFSDMLASSSISPWITAIGQPLSVDISDSAATRKMKQMLDGSITGAAVGAVMDMYRIARYAGLARKVAANGDGKQLQQIVDLFDGIAQDVGDGVIRGQEILERGGRLLSNPELPPAAAVGRQGREMMEGFDRLQPARLGDGAPAVDADVWDGGDLSMSGLMGDMAAGVDPGVSPWTDELGQTVAQARAMRDLDRPSIEEVRAGRADVAARSEATVTPDTWRALVEVTAADLTVNPRAREAALQKLGEVLPQRRTSQIDLLEQFRLRENELGILPAADALYASQVTRRALGEGWGRVGDGFELQFNRGKAFELGRSDYDIAIAKQLDRKFALKEQRMRDAALKLEEELVEANRRFRDEAFAKQGEWEDAQGATRAYDQWEEGQAVARDREQAFEMQGQWEREAGAERQAAEMSEAAGAAVRGMEAESAEAVTGMARAAKRTVNDAVWDTKLSAEQRYQAFVAQRQADELQAEQRSLDALRDLATPQAPDPQMDRLEFMIRDGQIENFPAARQMLQEEDLVPPQVAREAVDAPPLTPEQQLPVDPEVARLEIERLRMEADEMARQREAQRFLPREEAEEFAELQAKGAKAEAAGEVDRLEVVGRRMNELAEKAKQAQRAQDNAFRTMEVRATPAIQGYLSDDVMVQTPAFTTAQARLLRKVLKGDEITGNAKALQVSQRRAMEIMEALDGLGITDRRQLKAVDNIKAKLQEGLDAVEPELYDDAIVAQMADDALTTKRPDFCPPI